MYKSILLLTLMAIPLFPQTIRLSDPERSVVQIVVQKPDSTMVPYGTGFFVRSDGVIATALHVYNQAVLATAETRGGRLLVRRATRQSGRTSWSAVDVLQADATHDLVLLRLAPATNTAEVWDAVGGIRTLSPTMATELEANLGVRVVGYFGSDLYPVTLSAHLVGESPFTISTGFANGAPTSIEVPEFLVSAFAVPGHSGSPVLLDDGSVLGVMISMVPVSVPFNNQPLHSGLNRVTKAEHLHRMITALPPPASPPSPSGK